MALLNMLGEEVGRERKTRRIERNEGWRLRKGGASGTGGESEGKRVPKGLEPRSEIPKNADNTSTRWYKRSVSVEQCGDRFHSSLCTARLDTNDLTRLTQRRTTFNTLDHRKAVTEPAKSESA